ncbi:MAG: dienelactone hydrolase family protein [Cyanobacteria bacterium J06638_28]
MTLKAIAKMNNGQPPADKLLVGLHGWGANAEDLAGLADYLPLTDYQMMFPDAPLPHPYNPVGRMWYGFPPNYDFRTPHDFAQQADLQASRQQLRDWLTTLAQATHIPLEKTVLIGFSQGGAMALDVGLQLPFAGVVVLSGYLHSAPAPHQNLGPVLVVHGRQDAVVPIAKAHETKDVLKALSVDASFLEFDMGHEVSLPALQQVQHFCRQLEK